MQGEATQSPRGPGNDSPTDDGWGAFKRPCYRASSTLATFVSIPVGRVAPDGRRNRPFFPRFPGNFQ
jgi:hypothetical protein